MHRCCLQPTQVRLIQAYWLWQRHHIFLSVFWHRLRRSRRAEGARPHVRVSFWRGAGVGGGRDRGGKGGRPWMWPSEAGASLTALITAKSSDKAVLLFSDLKRLATWQLTGAAQGSSGGGGDSDFLVWWQKKQQKWVRIEMETEPGGVLHLPHSSLQESQSKFSSLFLHNPGYYLCIAYLVLGYWSCYLFFIL